MRKIINILKILLFFVIILFVIFFSIVNSDIVKVNFNFFPFHSVVEIRTFLLIIFCFCIGFLCGILASSYSLILKHIENFKEKRKVKKLQKVLEKTQEEISNE